MSTVAFTKILYDIDNNFGNDINFNGSNDLNTVSESDRSQQRVLRRLLTTPLDYVWHPGYGAGLPADIGQPLNADLYNRIRGRVLSQIFLEPSVSKQPAPVITFQDIPGGFNITIKYTEYPSRQPIVLTRSVTR